MGKIRVMMFLALLVALFAGTAKAYEKPVYNITFVRDGIGAKHATTAATVGDFLASEGITPSDIDKISPDPASRLKSGITVTYERYYRVTIIADGKPVNAAVTMMTVSDVIRDFSKRAGVTYMSVSDGVDGLKITDDTVLEIASTIVKKITVTLAVPYTSRTVDNPDRLTGESYVSQTGVNGKQVAEIAVKYVNGVEESRETLNVKTTVPPVEEIISVGTKPPPTPKPTPAPARQESISQYSYDKTPPTEYRRKVTMTATAYTADYASTGKRPGDKGFGVTASGMMARYGVVSVDPKVIPLHTNLYIEGYGYAVAGDTGSGINGNKIDLFFDTASYCRQFGVQSVVVYILD